MQIHFLRISDVLKLRGRKRTALYQDIRDGLFPSGVDLGGGRAVGWPAHEVEAINRAILAGKSGDELRSLVKKLLAQRVEEVAA